MSHVTTFHGHVNTTDQGGLQLLRAGLRRGAPPQVTEQSLAVEVEAAAEMYCPRCLRFGLAFRPWHRGQQYVGVVVCSCGFAEEA
jgi:hypothetical protein